MKTQKIRFSDKTYMTILSTHFLAILTLFLVPAASNADMPEIDYALYLNLSQSIRDKMDILISLPLVGPIKASYESKKGDPFFSKPRVSDLFFDSSRESGIRNFWDKIMLQDGSVLKIAGDEIPLTCIFINGHDNRYSKKDTPLIPDFFIKVYLVANDYTCTGPINPNWPKDGGKKETWDTYVYYEIRDPTIMLPTELKIRYRWSEFRGTILQGGAP
jgi:hypothetical protein